VKAGGQMIARIAREVRLDEETNSFTGGTGKVSSLVQRTTNQRQ